MCILRFEPAQTHAYHELVNNDVSKKMNKQIMILKDK